MSEEEIVTDDEIIDGELDPNWVTEVKEEETISDNSNAQENELEKSKESLQLSGDEETVGQGDSIMVRNNIRGQPDAEREKQLLKELFPHVYKQRYPDE